MIHSNQHCQAINGKNMPKKHANGQCPWGMQLHWRSTMQGSCTGESGDTTKRWWDVNRQACN